MRKLNHKSEVSQFIRDGEVIGPRQREQLSGQARSSARRKECGR